MCTKDRNMMGGKSVDRVGMLGKGLGSLWKESVRIRAGRVSQRRAGSGM